MSSEIDNTQVLPDGWASIGLCRVCSQNACLPGSDFCPDCEAEIVAYHLHTIRHRDPDSE